MTRPTKPKKVLRLAGQLIQDTLERSGFRPTDYPLFQLWDNVLGREASHAQAVGVKNRRLYIDVDTSARLHTLTLRKRELLQKINGAFGGNAPLSDIILRLGKNPPLFFLFIFAPKTK
jgi:predicted nucleic acid-binding Zn ribbon protein